MSNASIIVSASNGAFFRNSVVGDALFYTQSNSQNMHIGVNSNANAGIVLSSNQNRVFGNTAIVNDFVTSCNLFAYYPFDTNANDAASNFNLSTIGSVLYQPGIINNGALFTNPPSSNAIEYSYVENTTLGSTVLTGPPISISYWFNLASNVAGNFQPCMFFIGGSNVIQAGIGVNINAGNGIILTVNTTGSGGVKYPYPAAFVATSNTWTHIALTYDNSNISTYINGSLLNTSNLTGNFAVTGANCRLRIGGGAGYAGINNYGFPGMIDDFRIYNRVLTTSDVSNLYTRRPSTYLCSLSNNTSNYVGICTPSPQQALEVGGNIMCTGNLSAGNIGMFRNRIINGDMRIAQRATTGTVTTSGTPYLSVDRWFIDTNISAGGVSLTRNALSSTTDSPYAAGIQFYVRLQGTSTQTYSWLIPTQSIEGYNIVDFNWGTTYGSYVTLSFWLRTNLAAGSLIGVAIRNNASTAYTTNVTVVQSVQWQYYNVTIPPPPAGTSWDTTNGAGLRVCIGLVTPGATATANTWNLTNVLNTSTAANPYTNNTNYVDFTGVQLEKGTMATPFEFRPYGVELQMCHRYFWAISPTPSASTYPLIGCGYWQNGTYAWVPVTTPTCMRDPNSSSLVVSNLGSLTITYNGGVYGGLTLSKNSHIQNIFSIGVTKSGGAAGANQLAALYDNTTTPSVVIYINNEL